MRKNRKISKAIVFAVVLSMIMSALSFSTVYASEAKTTTIDYGNGAKYVGEVKNGTIRHGQGTMTWANGEKYVGEWDNHARHGQGTMTYNNGNVYVGEFKGNKTHGKGTMTKPDGTVWEQVYDNGKLVSEKKATSAAAPEKNTTAPDTKSAAKAVENTQANLKTAIENGVKGSKATQDYWMISLNFVSGMTNYFFKGFPQVSDYGNKTEYTKDILVKRPVWNGFYVIGNTKSSVPDGNCVLWSVAIKEKAKADFLFDIPAEMIYGTFVNGKLNGPGKVTDDINNISYQGYFKDGKFHGTGNYTDGENVWAGEWKDGAYYLGMMTIKDSNGTEIQYRGYFENGLLQGLGAIRVYTTNNSLSSYVMYYGYFVDSQIEVLMGYEDVTAQVLDEQIAGLKKALQIMQEMEASFNKAMERSNEIWKQSQTNIDKYKNNLEKSQPPSKVIPVPTYGLSREDRGVGVTGSWEYIIGK